MSCLYDSMKANGLIDDINTTRSKYCSIIENNLLSIYDKKTLCDIGDMTLNPYQMGSINVLWLFLNENPHHAFIIKYDACKEVILLNEKPEIVKTFMHYGSHDSGHFTAGSVQDGDLERVIEEWARRRNSL
jgi:hypothetical protein